PETFVQEIDGFLPAAQRTTTALSPAAPAPVWEKMPPGYTILVMDNLPVNRSLNLDLALVSSGYRVLAAGSIAEGLSLARRHPCDLILSAACTPEGSGYDFLLAVQADLQLAAIPF